MLHPPRCIRESAVFLWICLSTVAAPSCTLNISHDGQTAPSPFAILSAVDAARQTLAPFFLRKHLEKNATFTRSRTKQLLCVALYEEQVLGSTDTFTSS